MRIIDCIQGTEEWKKARLGVPTASQFDKIITPAGKPSKSAETYLYQLAAEYILQQPYDMTTSEFMQRGTALEAEARRFYEFQKDIDVQEVGFCLTDDGLAGCSPDGLIGDDGGLEIKCLSAGRHIAHLLKMSADDYKVQIQGSLYVTGRDWWDQLAYNPAMPSPIIRCHRDEPFIALLDEYLKRFLNQLEGCIARLATMGIKQVTEEIDEELEELFPA